MAVITTSSALALAGAFVVLAGAGVSVAAEGSVPGDVLYGFKIGINENVRASLAFDTSSQAEYEADLASTRLEEMIDLAIEESLDAETRASLAEQFQSHSEQALALAAEASAEGEADEALEALVSFQEALEIHIDVLAELKNDEFFQAEAETLIGLAGNVKLKVDRAVSQLEVEANAEMDAEARSEIEVIIQSTRDLLDRMETKVQQTSEGSAELRAEAQVKISAAADQLLEAQAQLRQRAFVRAKALSESASSTAAELKGTLEDTLDLDFDAQSSVNVSEESQVEANENDTEDEEVESDIDADVDTDVDVKVESDAETDVRVGY